MLDESPLFKRFGDAAQASGWSTLFPALEDLYQDAIGHRLFSCSIFRMSGLQSGVAARIYSNDLVHYPLSGLKEIVPNRWTEQVIARREIFVANSVAGFSDVFPDHALIASLGLGSVVNVPIVLRGDFVGTVNLLHEAGYYTPERLAPLDSLTLPALLAFGLVDEAATGEAAA